MRGHRGHGPRHCDVGRQACGCEVGRLRGFLEPVAVLLIAGSPAHGYDLLPRLVEFGLDAQSVDPGTLYRALRRLEDDGILRSEWSTDGSGPARRVYSVTPEGYEFLRSWHTAVTGIRESLGRFLVACGDELERQDKS